MGKLWGVPPGEAARVPSSGTGSPLSSVVLDSRVTITGPDPRARPPDRGRDLAQGGPAGRRV